MTAYNVVCMYVCMYACMYVHIYIYTWNPDNPIIFGRWVFYGFLRAFRGELRAFRKFMGVLLWALEITDNYGRLVVCEDWCRIMGV